jgi:phenylalanyl-tRNA synthetase beta chain
MKIPLSWLKEYVDIALTPEQLKELFNAKILEVESMEKADKGITGVIVAQIKEVNKHPNADKLHVLRVDTGTEELQIVCGAQNVAVGKKIALGLVGAELPGGLKLKRAKIRDVESFGMCCSEKELGLADTSEGILHLAADAQLGTDYVKYAGLDDVIYDLAILPNRGDCQSLRAVAIELHAATGATLHVPVINKKVTAGKQQLSIAIENSKLCNRYMGCVMTVAVKPSPEWLQKKLKAVGLRPINNIVDITNYVLFELGQPLHAFDYKKLIDGKIIVRTARAGEKIETLDNQVLELKEEMLVIADAKNPVALAGIMGGAHSAVDDKTTTILLEAAFFNPTSIRRTSKATSLRTDASMRFEKSVSYDGVADGFYRAIQLFQEIADGVVVSELVDNAPVVIKPLTIELDPQWTNKVLGITISTSEQEAILRRLQFEVTTKGSVLSVVVPTARIHDIYRPIDLVEEIARIFGYDRIPSTKPHVMVDIQPDAKREYALHAVHALLRSAGFSETISYSMTAPTIYQQLGLADQFKKQVIVTNPISVEDSVMRQSLIPQLLHGVVTNQAQQIETVGLYELGNVYTTEKQTSTLAACYTGIVEQGVLQKADQRQMDFYTMKGIVENILAVCGIPIKKLERSESPFVHPGKSLEISGLLMLGEVSPIITGKLKITQPVFVLEINLERLIQMTNLKKVFAPLNQYPASRRDVAFVIERTVSAAQIEKVMREASPDVVEAIELFDYYTGTPIPEGSVSLAYAITYRAQDRTLTDGEITAAHAKVTKALATLNAAIR